MNNIQASIDSSGGQIGLSYSMTNCSGSVVWDIVKNDDNWFVIDINPTAKTIDISCSSGGGVIRECQIEAIVNGQRCPNSITVSQDSCDCKNLSYVYLDIVPSSGLASGDVIGHYAFNEGDVCPDSPLSFTIDSGITSFEAVNGEIILTDRFPENFSSETVSYNVNVLYSGKPCRTVSVTQEGFIEKCNCYMAVNYFIRFMTRHFPFTGNTSAETIASAVTTCGDIKFSNESFGCDWIADGYPTMEIPQDRPNVRIFKVKAKDTNDTTTRSCAITFQFENISADIGELSRCTTALTLVQDGHPCRCSDIAANTRIIVYGYNRYSSSYSIPGRGYYPCYYTSSGDSINFTLTTSPSVSSCYAIELNEVSYSGIPLEISYTKDTTKINPYAYVRIIPNLTINNTYVELYNIDGYKCINDHIVVDIKATIVADYDSTNKGGVPCTTQDLQLTLYPRTEVSCDDLESVNMKTSDSYSHWRYVSDTEAYIKYNTNLNETIELFVLTALDGCEECGDWTFELIDNGGFIDTSYLEFYNSTQDSAGSSPGFYVKGSLSSHTSTSGATFRLTYNTPESSCTRDFKLTFQEFDEAVCSSCTENRITFSQLSSTTVGQTEIRYYSAKLCPQSGCSSLIDSGRINIGELSLSNVSDQSWITSVTIVNSGAFVKEGGCYVNRNIVVELTRNLTSSERYGEIRFSLGSSSSFSNCTRPLLSFFQQGESQPVLTSCTCSDLMHYTHGVGLTNSRQGVSSYTCSGSSGASVLLATIYVDDLIINNQNCAYIRLYSGEGQISSLSGTVVERYIDGQQYEYDTYEIYGIIPSNSSRNPTSVAFSVTVYASESDFLQELPPCDTTSQTTFTYYIDGNPNGN